MATPSRLLSVVMHSTRRILIGLTLAIFVAALAAPLAAALSLCHMPCCHHGATAAAPPCPMKCTISKAPVEVPATASVSLAPAAPLIRVEQAPAARRVALFLDTPISPHRPLHLVHAVFLI
jgi:hypothetical protein